MSKIYLTYRGRVIAVFLLCMSLAITLTISFSIWFIREHLLKTHTNFLQHWAEQVVLTSDSTSIVHLSRALQIQARTIAPSNTQHQHTPKETIVETWATDSAGRLWRFSSSTDQVREELKPIRWYIYYGMFITVGLVVGLGGLLARELTRPIRTLQAGAAKLAAGQLDSQLEDGARHDELGSIGRSLNKLAADLKTENTRLREANMRQNQLLAEVAHELNNPLHTLRSALDLLQLDYLPAEKRNSTLTVASRTLDRMSLMLNDLLLIQRTGSDPELVRLQAVDLLESIRQVYDEHKPHFESKGLYLQLETADMDTAQAWVRADPLRLTQIFSNLLTNALKYTEHGGCTVRLHAQGTEWIRIDVQDTGTGISSEHLARLTQPFYRVDTARSRQHGGTGLGLTLVDRLLRLHHSELRIQSTEGNGSCFSFVLPRVRQPQN
jgi:signal transduction histidine kinase